MNSTSRVLIVGGGPCGLLSGLALAKLGIECTIFEKKPGLSTHPRAMGVSRRSAKIFRLLEIEDELKRGDLIAPDSVLTIWAKSLVGEELGRVPLAGHLSEFTPCTTMHVPQTWTEHVLYAALAQEAFAKIHFESDVLSVAQDDQGATASVRHADGREEAYQAPWLIAADGARSAVRHALGIEAEGPGEMGHFLNTFFRAPYGKAFEGRHTVLFNVLSEECMEFFVSVNGDDLWLMHHFLQPGETPDMYPPERLAGMIRQASGMPEIPVEVLSVSPWVMSPKVSAQFRSGRIFLVGDAAARLSPAGGLGMNTGLQGAHNLAWKLALVVGGTAGDRLLDSYHDERHSVADRTMRTTNRNADEIFDIVAAAVEGQWDKVRDLIAHSRRRGSGLGQDLGTSYSEGAFVPDGSPAPELADPVNEYVPDARPGSRAPHLWVEAAGRRRSLLDVYSPEAFTLVAGPDGATWRDAVSAAALPVQSVLAGIDLVVDWDAFASVYRITRDGAVLVRPDGYVAARWREATADCAGSLASAFQKILAR